MEAISKELRKTTLYLSHQCNDGNLQSAFSCIDIIWALYDRIMNWSPRNAQDEERDIFIISKGQATLALYAVLIEKGMFDLEEIAAEIGKFDSRYCIQTDVTKFDGGIENNAGSLGHGFPFAAGIAFANRVKGLKSRVFVLCGDGEFCEGTMWEACIFAGSKKLDNLCVIIDDNHSAGEMMNLDNMAERLALFGFDAAAANGHSFEELENCFSRLLSLKNGRPKAVVASTVRGYGSRTLEERDVWFHKAPNVEELDMLNKEVDAFEAGISGTRRRDDKK